MGVMVDLTPSNCPSPKKGSIMSDVNADDHSDLSNDEALDNGIEIILGNQVLLCEAERGSVFTADLLNVLLHQVRKGVHLERRAFCR
jgi:hypothetical protein